MQGPDKYLYRIFKNGKDIMPLTVLDAAQLSDKYTEHIIWMGGTGGTRGNFDNCDLSNLTPNTYNFKGASFINCKFGNVLNCNFGDINVGGTYYPCDLSAADFSSSNVTNCDFRYSIIAQANFDNSHLTNCDFTSATVNYIPTVHFKNVTATDCTIGFNFNYVDLTDTKFIGCSLIDSSFSRFCVMSNVVFNGCDLDSVTFGDVGHAGMLNMSTCSFVNNTYIASGSPNSSSTAFYSCILDNVSFSYQNLTGCTFHTCSMLCCKFIASNMTDVDTGELYDGLGDTNMKSINWTGSKFYGATLNNWFGANNKILGIENGPLYIIKQ